MALQKPHLPWRDVPLQRFAAHVYFLCAGETTVFINIRRRVALQVENPYFGFLGRLASIKGKRPCNTLSLLVWSSGFIFHFAAVIVPVLFLFIFLLLVCSIILGGVSILSPFFVFSFFFNKSSIWVHSFCLFNLVVSSTYCFLLRGLADSDGKKGILIYLVGPVLEISHSQCKTPKPKTNNGYIKPIPFCNPKGQGQKLGIPKLKKRTPTNGLTQHVLRKPLVNRNTCNATRWLDVYTYAYIYICIYVCWRVRLQAVVL